MRCCEHWISNFCTWPSALFDAHFGAKIGLCENFTPLNFQPFVFSGSYIAIVLPFHRWATKSYTQYMYSLNSVGNHKKIFYFIYIYIYIYISLYVHLYDNMWYQTLKHMSFPTIRNCSPNELMSAFYHRMTCNPKHRHLNLFGHYPPPMILPIVSHFKCHCCKYKKHVK
jgi:hypothetical protein